MNKYLLLYGMLTVFICTFQKMAESATYHFNKIGLKGYKKVVLVYFHDFPHQHKNLPGSPDCFFVPDLSAASDSIGKSIWRCRERISLLRPDTLINRWRREQGTNGAIDFSLPYSGIYHVAAYIKSVSSIANNVLPVRSISAGTEVVTGIFLRHSMNVRTYTFESISTGQTSEINATPEHLFYVKNRHAWIPLYKITSDMVLTDNHNHSVKLHCFYHRQGYCGVPLRPGEVTVIHNLEVHKKHVYFAGRQSLLVHNIYYHGLYPEAEPESLESMVIRKMARPLVSASYQTMLEELFEHKINARFDSGTISSVFRKEISELMDRVVRRYNQRMRRYRLVPYELAYTFNHHYLSEIEGDDNIIVKRSFYGLFNVFFKHPQYFYASDYLTSMRIGDTGEPVGQIKNVSFSWDLIIPKVREENPSPLFLTFRSDREIWDIIRDFEKYSKLVWPHFSVSNARKFTNTIL